MYGTTGINWWNLIIFGPVIALLAVLWAIKLSYPDTDVRVIDGDTLEIGETTYRLWGIDAPEGSQAMVRGGWALNWPFSASHVRTWGLSGRAEWRAPTTASSHELSCVVTEVGR